MTRKLDDLMIIINSLTNSQHILIGFRLKYIGFVNGKQVIPNGISGETAIPHWMYNYGDENLKKKATIHYLNGIQQTAQLNSTAQEVMKNCI